MSIVVCHFLDKDLHLSYMKTLTTFENAHLQAPGLLLCVPPCGLSTSASRLFFLLSTDHSDLGFSL